MQKKYKIWIDEAGIWPWLWPVVACSLCFQDIKKVPKNLLDKITDSKKLTEKKREEIFDELIKLSTWENPQVYFWVWLVDNFLIDKINIKQANKEAMRRSLVEILRKIKKDSEVNLKWKDNISIEVFIDGKDNYSFEEIEKKPIYVIWGDSKIIEIWAASIIAKVFRDKLICTYSLLYPELCLENHKWYWTKKHQEFLTWKEKITWIHRISYKPIKKILEEKPKLLLHVCCGPDATIPIIDLKEKYDLTCFWYDPNIHPKSEYNKRLKAFMKVCSIEKIPFIEWEYDIKNYFDKVKWLEKCKEKWERCNVCYDLRLERSLKEAKKLWIKYWTTTLSISPHKDLEKIFIIWEKYNKNNSQEFLFIDFKKNDWFKRSIDYTTKHKIYRQNYCWCVYSKLKN